LKAVPNLKIVIFDVSSEYGINTLDVLDRYPSRIVLPDGLRGEASLEKAEDYLTRHVVPESLMGSKDELVITIKNLVEADKIRSLDMASRSEETVDQYTTYGGLVDTLTDILNEKFGSAPQKVLIPVIVDMVKNFMEENKFDEETVMDQQTLPVINSVEELLAQTKLREDSALKALFANLRLALSRNVRKKGKSYDLQEITGEIMSLEKSSPKLFVINLPEAAAARAFCSSLINQIFKAKKDSFTLDPRIVFVFDEAQEFIPYETRREDGTEYSSRAVERLLRHGRKYHVHGWISTQRIAHLNTNALQQLHSYFVSTMPRPYDRQLISDTFAIDDAFMERTLMFQNGDWLMTSFKATNTQNVPVFFHALNNEDFICPATEKRKEGQLKG
jgi:hypothetical protein